MLAAAPLESADQPAPKLVEIAVPTPRGAFSRFVVEQSPIMAPELAAQFPEIQTYRGQGVDDPDAVCRFDVTPEGFHAQVLAPSGDYYVDPYWHLDDSVYITYFKNDLRSSPDVASASAAPGLLQEPAVTGQRDPDAGEATGVPGASPPEAAPLGRTSGTQLRTYRLAVAATGEYTAFYGGTVAAGQAAIVTAVNRINGIYQRDLSIRLQLVASNSLLVYTNPLTDPYTNNSAEALVTQNQANLDRVIGTANYDIGHVFNTGGGGWSYVGVVGLAGWKAMGESGMQSPTGDAFYVDLVAHEIGHQFGADHSFNGVNGAAATGRQPGSAYEPGSGSTIMGYAGICGADDLQPDSDDYFHSVSLDQILTYVDVTQPGVGTRTATGNSVPSVSAGLDYTIPARTPFALTATGSDANGDALTYCWEERDLGPAQAVTAPDNGSSPIFRSFLPTPSPTRTFPRLSDLLNNTTVVGEQLPATSRTLNFRVTVRDNRSGGGAVNSDDTTITVVNTGAPFQVTSPNTAVTWTTSGTRTVTWNVAGTSGGTINAAKVNILLSTDGGQTFPVVLAANTDNDGSQTIAVPSMSPTTAARVKVQAAGNIFFDVSNVNFSIQATPLTADIMDVTPDPRTSAVSTIPIVFSEPVYGFDLADLSLTRNGTNVALTAATLTTTDNMTWTLGNLGGLTGTLVGATTTNYVVTLTAAGSGISDAAGNALAANATDAWQLQPTSFTGTANADTFEFIAAGAVGGLPTMHQLKLTLGGSPVVTYLYDASGSVALTLRGGLSNDTLRITGGPGMDTSSIYRYAILHVGPAAAGSAGYYSVYAPYADGSLETMVVDAGAGTGQRATLYNGPVSGDHFTASSWLRTGSMVGTGTGNVYNNSVKNFDQIYGASTGGGTDARANLSDSNGNDFFVCKTEGANAYSVMQRVSGGSGSAAYLWAGGGGFANVYGYSTAGGTDEAVLNGSSGNDTAVFQPQARRVRHQGRRRLLRIRLGLQESHGLSRAGHRRRGLPARDYARRHVHHHRGHGTALGDDPLDGRAVLEHRRGRPARRALGQGLWPGQLPWHDRRCGQGVPERDDRRRRAHRGRQAARDHLGRPRGECPVDGDRVLDPGAGVPAGLRRHEDRQRHGQSVRLHRRGSRAVLGREEGAQHGAERRGAERRDAGPCQRQPHCRPQLLLQGHRFGQQRE